MANPQTAAEWTATAESLKAQREENITLQNFWADRANELAKTKGTDSIEFKTAENNAYNLLSQGGTLLREQSQAMLQADYALQGPPNTSINTPPGNFAETVQAGLPASPTTSTVNDTISPAPVTTEQTAATNNVFNDRTIDAAPVVTPPYDEFAGVDAAVAAQAAAPVDTFLDPQQRAEAQAAALAEASAQANAASAADPVDAANDQSLQDQEDARQFAAAQPTISTANPVTSSAAKAQAGTLLAQRQATLEAQRKMTNNGDWRVRLSLAPSADYLYMATPPGILGPLAKTAGVIFPYTPKIDINYKANYSSYDLTHSNYKGYFYQNSYTDAVNMSATFTAQDSTEAEYLLAVIHFFRSVTKMFYGQDAERGAPPPLVFLTGLGQYQFSAHPCVVSSFTYALPADVDYIRARSVNINGTNLLSRRVRQDLPTNPISSAVNRLANLFSSQGILKGAISSPTAPPTLGKNDPTYVPTKLEISLTLLPMQTRSQVSQQFSVKGFANGDLLKGGFW